MFYNVFGVYITTVAVDTQILYLSHHNEICSRYVYDIQIRYNEIKIRYNETVSRYNEILSRYNEIPVLFSLL